MTVPTTSAYTGPYYPNGVTTQFPFGFKVNAETEVSVVLLNVDGSETVISSSDYTVALAAHDAAGGTVTMAYALPNDGRTLFVALDPEFTQQTKFEDEGAFNQSILNPTFDAGALRSIWLRNKILRAPVLPLDPSSVLGLFPVVLPDGRFGWSGGTGADAGLRGDLGNSVLGAALIAWRNGGVGSVIRSVFSRLFDLPVSVKDYGAVGDGVADDTAAIQAAIDTGAKELHFPRGIYRHGNLNFNVTYQRVTGPGAQLIRASAAATVTASARGVEFSGIRFSGGGLAGNNITVTGPEVRFHSCNSTDTLGRCLKSLDSGGGMKVLFGIWNTLDHTAAGYEFELADTVPGTSLYTVIMGVETQQSFGGVLINGNGTVRLADCQIGKLRVTSGGGIYHGNRFNGAVTVLSSTNLFGDNAFATNATFGDGVSANIGSILFASDNAMGAGETLTIHSNVVESSFFLNQLANVTLTITGNNNDIWHGKLNYNPALIGTGGVALGNGSLTGQYSRHGRTFHAYIQFVKGSTTNLGTGFGFTTPFKSSVRAQGIGICVVAGGIYGACADLAANTQNITIFAGALPIGGGLTANSPAVWANDDQALISITGEYVA